MRRKWGWLGGLALLGAVFASALAFVGAAPAPLKPAGEITNSLGMKFVRVPRGKFAMGSPASEPNHNPNQQLHDVEITEPFYLGAHEVTQQQFRKIMGSNPSYFSATGGGGLQVVGLDTSRFPVDSVTWLEAVEFCKKLAAQPKEVAARRTYRLPTEAEWEYACRAGTTTAFSFGKSGTSTQANFDGTQPYGGAPVGPNLRRTCAVGSYKPNAWGLYDMHGNVREWCGDWFGENYYRSSPAKGPPGPKDGTARCMRGGDYSFAAYVSRSAFRGYSEPTNRNARFGFRVVCVVGGKRR
jgi:formylglycine-generating enzyme required for sulfatase activity